MQLKHAICIMDSPIGGLRLEAGGGALSSIRFVDEEEKISPDRTSSNSLLERAEIQFQEYFSGERTVFDLPFAVSGTQFEQAVWAELLNIPFGCTITYGQLAKKVGEAAKVRAVGRANGQNPLPVLVPCHRVIGKGGKLTGYAGGIKPKKWLLRHEGALLL